MIKTKISLNLDFFNIFVDVLGQIESFSYFIELQYTVSEGMEILKKKEKGSYSEKFDDREVAI
jgi:hypothetical protein